MAPKELRGLSTSSSLLLFFFRKHFHREMFWKFPKNWLLPLQGGREREERLLVTQLMWKPLSFLFATCFVWAWIDPETTLFSPSSQVVFLYHMVQTQTKLDKTISNGGGVSCRVWARYATLLPNSKNSDASKFELWKDGEATEGESWADESTLDKHGFFV